MPVERRVYVALTRESTIFWTNWSTNASFQEMINICCSQVWERKIRLSWAQELHNVNNSNFTIRASPEQHTIHKRSALCSKFNIINPKQAEGIGKFPVCTCLPVNTNPKSPSPKSFLNQWDAKSCYSTLYTATYTSSSKDLSIKTN